MHFNNSIALVSYGNTLRCDDGAGIETARLTTQLARNLPVTLFEYQQLTIDIAYILKDFKNIVFFDCSLDIDYGSYLISSVNQKGELSISMSHHLTPSDLLVCIKSLYGNEPKGLLCQIGGRDFEFGAHLSDAVSKAIEECANAVVEILKALK